MKKNVIVVGIAFVAVLLIGCLAFMIEKLGEEPNPTPTPVTVPSKEAEPTKPATPTPSKADNKTPTPKPTKGPMVTEKPAASPTEIPEVTEGPTPTPEISGDLTAEQAIGLLKQLSADELMLPKDISLYKTEADSWTTMVRGQECYCINVYSDEEGLVGLFYIAVNGSVGYRVNENEEFVSIVIR